MSAVVSWDDKVYSYDRASNQLNQVRQTVTAYTNRAADAKHDLTYLSQQETRLSDLLSTLEAERTQFQSQISQLNRQVDAIARNERLISLMEERNKTIDECSKYDAISLDNIDEPLERGSQPTAEQSWTCSPTRNSKWTTRSWPACRSKPTAATSKRAWSSRCPK